MHHKVVLFPASQRSTFAKQKIARTQDIERRITKPSSIAIKNNFALKTGHPVTQDCFMCTAGQGSLIWTLFFMPVFAGILTFTALMGNLNDSPIWL